MSDKESSDLRSWILENLDDNTASYETMDILRDGNIQRVYLKADHNPFEDTQSEEGSRIISIKLVSEGNQDRSLQYGQGIIGQLGKTAFWVCETTCHDECLDVSNENEVTAWLAENNEKDEASKLRDREFQSILEGEIFRSIILTSMQTEHLVGSLPEDSKNKLLDLLGKITRDILCR